MNSAYQACSEVLVERSVPLNMCNFFLSIAALDGRIERAADGVKSKKLFK